MPDITLTVADDHLARITQVADAARAAGMQVDEVLDRVGMICGSAPEGCRPALEGLDGVESVEQSRTYHLAPPDSPIQ